jgi:hypothetical protein
MPYYKPGAKGNSSHFNRTCGEYFPLTLARRGRQGFPESKSALRVAAERKGEVVSLAHSAAAYRENMPQLLALR